MRGNDHVAWMTLAAALAIIIAAIIFGTAKETRPVGPTGFVSVPMSDRR